MGTNYYRIPNEAEMEERKARLLKRVQELEMDASSIERKFSTIPTHDSDYSWEHESPWDEFTRDTAVHLGKRSSGWKFCWNFHNDLYYHNKESLVNFVHSGRVVDEYGTEIDPHEFLSMAFEWGSDYENGGWDHDSYYKAHPESRSPFSHLGRERYVDGLRVSDSTDFC